MTPIQKAATLSILCLTGAVMHSAAAASAKGFDKAADKALAAMRKRAGELGIGGVAVVAWFEGESIRSWTSKMVVVGRYKDEPTANNKGSNLLAIAYSKASEMADTLKNSGPLLNPKNARRYQCSFGSSLCINVSLQTRVAPGSTPMPRISSPCFRMLNTMFR